MPKSRETVPPLPAESISKNPVTLHCRAANDPEFNCQQTFSTEISEIRHYGLSHGENAPWRRTTGLKCPNCPILFRNQQGMREHLRSSHNVVNYSAVLPSAEEFRAVSVKRQPKRVGRPRKDQPAESKGLIPTEFFVAAVHEDASNGYQPKPVDPKLEIARALNAAFQSQIRKKMEAYADAIHILQAEFAALERM